MPRNFNTLIFMLPLLIGIAVFYLYWMGVFESDLFKAIEKGNIELVKKIVEDNKQEAKRYQGSITPLHQAAYYNQTNIAEILIKCGADVDAKGGRHNFTPIFISASKGDIEFIKLLISSGAEIDIKDDLGQTPLITAVINDNLQAVKIFVSSGVNLRVRDKNYKTALDYALKNSNGDIAIILKDHSGHSIFLMSTKKFNV